MPDAKRKSKEYPRPSRQLFDAQMTFSITSVKKRAIVAQCDGAGLKVYGDVLRLAVDEYFVAHQIDWQTFE